MTEAECHARLGKAVFDKLEEHFGRATHMRVVAAELAYAANKALPSKAAELLLTISEALREYGS